MEKQLEYYQNKLAYEMDSSDLFEAIQNGMNVIVIDARKEFAYEKEHIPNAINILHRDMNEIFTAKLDKKVLCVVYCDGIGCNASTKGAFNMAKLGFSVKELIGGIEWWKFDGYSTECIESQNTCDNQQCGC